MKELPRISLHQPFSVKDGVAAIVNEAREYFRSPSAKAVRGQGGMLLAIPFAWTVPVLAALVAAPLLGLRGDASLSVAFWCGCASVSAAIALLIHSATFIPRPLRPYLTSQRRRVKELQQEIDAFNTEISRIFLLKDRTPHYAAIREQCEERYNELYARYRAIVDPLDALVEPFRAEKRRKEEQGRLQKEADELRRLKNGLAAVLPSHASGKFTDDMTPYVGMLQAEEILDRQKHGLPSDGSLWDPEHDPAPAAAPSRDRE